MTKHVRNVTRQLAVLGAFGSIILTGLLVGPAHALPLGTTERVSVGTAGEQGNFMSGRFAGPAIDADGSVVAFDSEANTLVSGDSNGDVDVFVRDRTTGTLERVSVRSNGNQANGDSTRPALDATGNQVATVPWESRNVVSPLSAEIPAPVRTTIRMPQSYPSPASLHPKGCASVEVACPLR